MIHLVTTDSAAREAGVVYTRSWMVELVLDLAGYLPERRLGEMVAMEPSAGDGAFLSAMVRRLVDSCERHGIPLATAGRAIQAFEIDPVAAERAGRVVCETLGSLRVPAAMAEKLARQWVKTGDFLEASLCFPIADFVIGNPPYIRLEEIPASKAAMYRNSFSTMRGRADIYIAFYQAALLQLKVGGVCAYICADRWMLNDYLRFQAQYLRRIRVPDPAGISPKLAQELRDAFDTQDFKLATRAAMEVYQIDNIPQ